jgi:putative protease
MFSPPEKMELLAPAGSLDVLKEVIDAGCDAVFISGKNFGMRQHAAWLNFKAEEMAAGVQYAHDHQVKLYVTVNSLLSSTEIDMLGDYLMFLQDLAPDALLLQDLGVLGLCHRLNIRIPLHASTMMNIHNSAAARHLREWGVTRIVCSRDIPLYELARIRQEASIEVEYFLHNDICISQGSLCYLSGIATDKSSNRGLCIKPCRWQWEFVEASTGQPACKNSGRYLLAKKDLCLYHQIPELVSSGIDCVKIEGRARKADYLVPIVQSYRRAIDRYYDDPYGYATDFGDFDAMSQQQVRDYTTNHAFKDPGIDGCANSGAQEPRIFSIVAEEKDNDEELKKVFSQKTLPLAPLVAPSLVVRCGSAAGAIAAVDAGADLITIGGEFFHKNRGCPWSLSQLTEIVEKAHRAGAEIGISSPRILGNRESFEFKKILQQADLLGIRKVYTANLGAYAFVRENDPMGNFDICADFTWNLFNSEALRHLQTIGISSATLSPELTFNGVTFLIKEAKLPVEILVHGSIASMLLESCLIAGLLGHLTKQDACPGHCTRKSFGLRDRLGKTRLLAPDQYCRNHLLTEKDLCLLDVLSQVAAAGAGSVRIEAQYYDAKTVAVIVSLYRKYIDYLHRLDAGEGLVISKEDWQQLRLVSPRPLGYGAYVNATVDLAEPDSCLPTEEMYLHKAGRADVNFSG